MTFSDDFRQNLGPLDTPSRASADATSPETMPRIWYCESCGQMVACEIVNGEIVCGYKHIVATFDAASGSLPTGPTRADIEALPRFTPDEAAEGGPCMSLNEYGRWVDIGDILALFPAPDAGPDNG